MVELEPRGLLVIKGSRAWCRSNFWSNSRSRRCKAVMLFCWVEGSDSYELQAEAGSTGITQK